MVVIHPQGRVPAGPDRFLVKASHLLRSKRYAVAGRYIKLKSEDGTWDDGWMVHRTNTELPTKVVLEREQDYRQTRKASDV